MNFECTSSEIPRYRLFFFDKDRGAEFSCEQLMVNTQLLILVSVDLIHYYYQILVKIESFLEWLKQLVSVLSEPISAEDVALPSAINGNYKLDPKNRKLKYSAFLGLEGPGTLAGRLAMWHSNGSHARIFDNDEDVIDFSQAKCIWI